MTRPTAAEFGDTPALEFDDPSVGVEVATNTPTVLEVRTRYAIATAISVVGSVAAGERVTFRATAADAWAYAWVTDKKTKKREKQKVNKGKATAAELAQLRWRVHCGGELLVDQRPGSAGDAVTVTLPRTLKGESVVALAYNEEPLVWAGKEFWIEDPKVQGGRRAGQGGGLLERPEQLAAMVGRSEEFRTRRLPARYVQPIFEHFMRLAPRYECTTTLQQAHFFAQVRLETGGLTAFVEGISRKKAEHDYATTSGNTGKEDAWGFRGRGILQTTGYHTYRNLFRDVRGRDVSSHADLRALAPQVETDLELATEAGLYFWSRKPCRDRAALDDVLGTSIRVNGWLRPPEANYIPIGYTERVGYLAECKRILGLVR